MSGQYLDWDSIAEEIAEKNRKISDSVDAKKQKIRAEEEFERGVRLGWFDRDGNSLLDDEEDDSEGDEE